MLWPVFMEAVVQEDHRRLFELDDVVTLPVTLLDTARARGWPEHLGVQTTVTLSGRGDRWATTADGLSCHIDLARPVDEGRQIRAGLDVPMMTIGPFSFVTGTVRRIELASVREVRAAEREESTRSAEQWALTEIPVVPVRFRHSRDPLDVVDRGVVIHLEVLMPRCRCRDVGELVDEEAERYARRHLHEIAADIEAGTTQYVCPNTGAIWLWHRWKRKRAMEYRNLKLWSPMLLTQQQPGPDRASSQPLPQAGEFDPIARDALTGRFRDVAQVDHDARSMLERAGVRLSPIERQSEGPVAVAAIQLADGTQGVFVEHLAHPERFIDVRAQTSAPSSKLAANQLLAAVGVPDAHVLWLLEHWLA